MRFAFVFIYININQDQHWVDKDEKAIRNKLKNLKANYQKIKDDNNRSGRGTKTMEVFDGLDEILGSRSATRPTNVVESVRFSVSFTSR